MRESIISNIMTSEQFIERIANHYIASIRTASADDMSDEYKTARWWAFNAKALSDEMLFKSELYKLFTDQQIEVMAGSCMGQVPGRPFMGSRIRPANPGRRMALPWALIVRPFGAENDNHETTD